MRKGFDLNLLMLFAIEPCVVWVLNRISFKVRTIAKDLLTLCMCAMTSVCVECSSGSPLISRISSATSRSALSAGEPTVERTNSSGKQTNSVGAVHGLGGLKKLFSFI